MQLSVTRLFFIHGTKIGRAQDQQLGNQHLCSYVTECMSYRQYQQLQLRRQDCFMRTTIAATAAEEHKELTVSIASQTMKGTEGLSNHYQQGMANFKQRQLF